MDMIAVHTPPIVSNKAILGIPTIVESFSAPKSCILFTAHILGPWFAKSCKIFLSSIMFSSAST
jgi:hypothetical protein